MHLYHQIFHEKVTDHLMFSNILKVTCILPVYAFIGKLQKEQYFTPCTILVAECLLTDNP